MGKEIKLKRVWLAVAVAVMMLIGIWPWASFAAVSDGDKATVDYTNLIKDIDGNTYVNPDYPSVNQYRYLLNIAGETDRYCYCIDPGTDLAASGSELKATSIHGNHTYWSNLSKKKKQGVTLAAIYGWRSNAKISQVEPELKGKVTEDDVWYATQCIIWEYIRGYRTSPTERDNNFYYNCLKNRSAEVAYKWILKQMKHHTDSWSFAKRMSDSDTVGPSHMLYYNEQKDNYRAVLTDENEIEYGMKGVTPSSVAIKRSGYEYTVTTDSSLGDGHKDVVFGKKIDYNEQPSFVWEQGDKQVMYTGSEDLIDWTFRITTENWGRIEIEKYFEESGGYGVAPAVNAVQTPEADVEFLVMDYSRFNKKYEELYGESAVDDENENYVEQALEVYSKLPKYSQTARHKDRITTGTDGKARTVALALGKYWIVQVSGSNDKWDAEPFEVEIVEGKKAGTVKSVRVENEVVNQQIKIVKQDAETGIQIEEAGAEFKIRDRKTGEFIRLYPMNEDDESDVDSGENEAAEAGESDDDMIDTFVTDASGIVVLPQTLKIGEYELVEVKAPFGYAINETPVEFEVTKECERDGEILLIMNDAAQKGVINILKKGITLDKSSGKLKKHKENLANVEFDIVADEDIETQDGTLRAMKGEVVDTVITDENGKARSCELYLGKYRIVEKAMYEKNSAGKMVKIQGTDWNMNAECMVEFEYDESQAPLIEVDKTIENERVINPVAKRFNHRTAVRDRVPQTGDYDTLKWPVAVIMLAALIMIISLAIRRKN